MKRSAVYSPNVAVSVRTVRLTCSEFYVMPA
jgi:hypothetical protein